MSNIRDIRTPSTSSLEELQEQHEDATREEREKIITDAQRTAALGVAAGEADVARLRGNLEGFFNSCELMGKDTRFGRSQYANLEETAKKAIAKLKDIRDSIDEHYAKFNQRLDDFDTLKYKRHAEEEAEREAAGKKSRGLKKGANGKGKGKGKGK